MKEKYYFIDGTVVEAVELRSWKADQYTSEDQIGL